jgi:hypothetical protein
MSRMLLMGNGLGRSRVRFAIFLACGVWLAGPREKPEGTEGRRMGLASY